LNQLRCIKHNTWYENEVDCPKQCGYHSSNNTEIHYVNLHKSNARFRIAERWMKFIIDEGLSNNYIYFSILGINLSNIDFDIFGGKKGSTYNIYNRFFRTALIGSFKYFFKQYDKLVINHIYHDIGGQQEHKFFRWYTIKKLTSDIKKINFLTDSIEFIDSDHRKSFKSESSLIQLIDLILGATVINLHSHSKNKFKRDIGLKFQPLLKNILHRKQRNKRWYGKYYKDKRVYRRCSVSFFPKNKGSLEEIKTQLDLFGGIHYQKSDESEFFYDRRILLSMFSSLDEWIYKRSV